MASTKPIDINAARTALRKNFDKIIESTIDPFDPARKLFAAQILPDDVYLKVLDENVNMSTQRRMHLVLTSLRGAVTLNGRAFEIFLDILKEGDSVIGNSLAESLIKDYEDSKSSAILKKHQDDVVQVLPVQSTELLETLHAEDIITSETRNEVKDKGSEALVQAIVKTLDEHPDKLHSVVKILLLRDETVSIGEKMRKDLASEVQHDAKHLQTCNTTEPVSTDILNPPTEEESPETTELMSQAEQVKEIQRKRPPLNPAEGEVSPKKQRTIEPKIQRKRVSAESPDGETPPKRKRDFASDVYFNEMKVDIPVTDTEHAKKDVLIASAVDSTLPAFSSVMKIKIPVTEEATFDTMFLKFGITVKNLKGFILRDDPPLDDIKSILGLSYRALKPRLTQCTSTYEVLEIIEEKCSLLNLSCMKAIAEHFKIQEAQECIKKYEDDLSDFCDTIRLTSCMGKRLLQHSSSLSHMPLKCETVKFILEWETDDYTLSDIKRLLSKAFGELANEVIVVDIKTGNSITLTCCSPHTITSLLVLIVQRNLSILTEAGVIGLSIGYCVVLEYTAKKTSTEEETTIDIEHAATENKDILYTLEFQQKDKVSDGHEESNASSSSLRSYEPTVMQKEDVITTFGDDSKKAKEFNNQLTEQLKIFKEEINKLTADKKLLEKSLEIEKKISKPKSLQIQSARPSLYNDCV